MPLKNLLPAIDLTKAVIQPLHDPLFTTNRITTDVLRLDMIHPVISGNKWFKLKYYLEQAIRLQKRGIITFGGAYSNHIVASAYAAALSGLKSIGIIRGEKPAELSPSLQDALDAGMQLEFISRSDYKKKHMPDFLSAICESHKDYVVIPEGGAGHYGIQGASEIVALVDHSEYSHIICAVGTATTFAGIISASGDHQQVIGISVLKNAGNLLEPYEHLLDPVKVKRSTIIDRYHFGGYAKRTKNLIDFMNMLYTKEEVPTDFVYNGKLMYAVADLIQQSFFAQSSRILVIHSGGLQGNRSLPKWLI